MAFSARLWRGAAHPSQCTPLFTDEYVASRPALLEICRRLAIPDAPEQSSIDEDVRAADEKRLREKQV